MALGFVISLQYERCAMAAKVVTVEDLYHVPDHQKAEIVNGAIVLMPPTGDDPGYAGDEVFVALREYSKQTRQGRAVGDNKGFRVDLPSRQSFSPDAAFHIGAPAGMKFFEGAPIFAVEVRSAGDYGDRAEADMAAKRADYFAAGTQVVWDVDLLSEDVVRVYRVDQPNYPTIYRRGELAEAEPAVPGWTMPVNDLFAK
jgi:Uma2 family endonuclease